MLTGRLTRIEREDARDPRAWYERFVARAGEPVVRVAVRQAMKLMAEQFVLGRTIDEARRPQPHRRAERVPAFVRHARRGRASPPPTPRAISRRTATRSPSIGASARDTGEPSVFARPSISVKLSALHPRYEYPQRDARARGARAGGRLARARRASAADRHDDRRRGSGAAGAVARAVRARAARCRRSPAGTASASPCRRTRSARAAVVGCVVALARETRTRIPVRLVKGAYWDTEIKRAQVQGLAGYPVFTRKAHTDVSYLACAAALLEAGDARLPDVRDAQRAYDRLGERAGAQRST